MSESCVVVFDLDDTIYKEIEFVKSGYEYIAKQISSSKYEMEKIFNILINAQYSNKNAFEALTSHQELNIPKELFLQYYRCHYPNISLDNQVLRTLEILKANNTVIGLISDGRSITQKNKINALGLMRYISEDNIIISEEFGTEKPDIRNYKYFNIIYPDKKIFVYVGDNVKKDFISPNILGWKTIGLKDNGLNIHKQQFIDEIHNPDIWIDNIEEVLEIIMK